MPRPRAGRAVRIDLISPSSVPRSFSAPQPSSTPPSSRAVQKVMSGPASAPWSRACTLSAGEVANMSARCSSRRRRTSGRAGLSGPIRIMRRALAGAAGRVLPGQCGVGIVRGAGYEGAIFALHGRLDQEVSQRRVLGQQRTVQVAGHDVAVAGALLAVVAVVAGALGRGAQRLDAGAQRGL